MSLRSVRAYRGSRIRGCCAAAAICRRHHAAGHGVRACAALAARPREDQVDRHLQGQGRARRAGGADRRGLDQVRLGRPAGARHPQAPRRLDQLQAALSGAGQGPRALRRRLRRLRRRRDQEPGDGRGRADRGRLRAAAGDRSPPPTPPSPARRWSGTIARTTSASPRSTATRPRPTRPSPRPRMWSKQHLVINRVTTASMEPRGSIGDYNAIDDHYTIYTTLQRTHPYRAELAKLVLKVPEHKVRVVAGDIGGSFGMKSAVYNEVPLVLLASKMIGRPVKWMSTRSEAFLSDAQARDNVTDAELALDKDGTFLALPRLVLRQRRRLPAVRLPGLHRQSRHARRRLPDARRCMWSRRRCSPTPSRAALSRQRPAGGRLCDRAHGRSRRRAIEHGPGRAAAEELHPAGGDAVQDQPHLHL